MAWEAALFLKMFFSTFLKERLWKCQEDVQITNADISGYEPEENYYYIITTTQLEHLKFHYSFF